LSADRLDTPQPLGIDGEVRFVQFPHPGREHQLPADGRRPWRLSHPDEPHKRTFLRSDAAYRWSVNGGDEHGPVAFWGEWEGETHLVNKLEPERHGPRWLCQPRANAEPPERAEGDNPPENTDPFVWGDAITYTYCRQDRNSKLRRLGRGSLVLFGSNLDGAFVLDTVLVIAGWREHRNPRDLTGLVSDAHMKATILPMYGWGEDETTFRLYVGATPRNQVDGMYSFVPCRPLAAGRDGFARPSIELAGHINPNLRMAARILAPRDQAIATLWQLVAQQVVDRQLALATHLRLPGPHD
jgi:hypothetical protein